jgi:mannose-1-phosphate guanylyltransferase
MIDHYYAVIMAGGEGSRMWPLSRRARPKQMTRIGSERSLFQLTVDRIRDIFPIDCIYVVTVANQAQALQAQCPEIPVENFLLEPMPRGTASVVGLAAVALHQRDPQAVMAILAADHLIQNVEYFQKLLVDANELAQAGNLVTLGIQPTAPSTGYGYIQRGEPLDGFSFSAFQVQCFKEKPNEENARKFLSQGDHDWNSGMFIWRVDAIAAEIRRLMPELAASLDQIAAVWGSPAGNATLQAVWPGIKPETIDYGIMEKAQKVAVIPAAGLGWNDVGSWDSLFEVFPADQDGNIVVDAEFLGLSTSNSLVISEQKKRLVVTVGVSDLIVVDTPDAVLICTRDQAQRVKEIVNTLKQTEESRRYL